MIMDTSAKGSCSGNDYSVDISLKTATDVYSAVSSVVFIDIKIFEVTNMNNEITITFDNTIQCGQEAIGLPIVRHGEIIGHIVEVNKDFVTGEFYIKSLSPVFNDTTQQLCCFVME